MSVHSETPYRKNQPPKPVPVVNPGLGRNQPPRPGSGSMPGPGKNQPPRTMPILGPG